MAEIRHDFKANDGTMVRILYPSSIFHGLPVGGGAIFVGKQRVDCGRRQYDATYSISTNGTVEAYDIIVETLFVEAVRNGDESGTQAGS